MCQFHSTQVESAFNKSEWLWSQLSYFVRVAIRPGREMKSPLNGHFLLAVLPPLRDGLRMTAPFEYMIRII